MEHTSTPIQALTGVADDDVLEQQGRHGAADAPLRAGFLSVRGKEQKGENLFRALHKSTECTGQS